MENNLDNQKNLVVAYLEALADEHEKSYNQEAYLMLRKAIKLIHGDTRRVMDDGLTPDTMSAYINKRFYNTKLRRLKNTLTNSLIHQRSLHVSPPNGTVDDRGFLLALINNREEDMFMAIEHPNFTHLKGYGKVITQVSEAEKEELNLLRASVNKTLIELGKAPTFSHQVVNIDMSTDPITVEPVEEKGRPEVIPAEGVTEHVIEMEKRISLLRGECTNFLIKRTQTAGDPHVALMYNLSASFVISDMAAIQVIAENDLMFSKTRAGNIAPNKPIDNYSPDDAKSMDVDFGPVDIETGLYSCVDIDINDDEIVIYEHENHDKVVFRFKVKHNAPVLIEDESGSDYLRIEDMSMISYVMRLTKDKFLGLTRYPNMDGEGYKGWVVHYADEADSDNGIFILKRNVGFVEKDDESMENDPDYMFNVADDAVIEFNKHYKLINNTLIKRNPKPLEL